MPARDGKAVFVNVPWDPGYESLFVTMVGVLTFLGQRPRSALEVSGGGEDRLKGILELIRACPVSIHDLSRVGTPARFNMPFELGLAVSLRFASKARHDIFVMDAVERRLDRTLSDYKGRDPLIHHGTCDGMLGCLLDTFKVHVGDAPDEFRRAGRALREHAAEVKKSLRATSLFRPSLFRLLTAKATEIAVHRGFIRAKSGS